MGLLCISKEYLFLAATDLRSPQPTKGFVRYMPEKPLVNLE
jgi:hypothetical protein